VNLLVKGLEFLLKKLKHTYEEDTNKKITDFEINEDFFNENNQTVNIFSMAKKTVITRVLEVETSDAIVEFPQNRTLLVEQLTDEAPTKAAIVKDLRTMDDVFNHYKPSVKMEFEDKNGQTRKETLDFSELREFEKDGLLKKSHFMKELKTDQESYLKIEKQIRVNKALRDAISDPESKGSLIKTLQALLKELQDAK